MKKQLFIIYDRLLEDQATLLYNLLSQHTDIKASIYTKKEIKKLVSREKCLYIGADCSGQLTFDNSYNEFGINIGCKGTKAWIRCFTYEWNVDRLNEFEKILKSYTDKHQLKLEYDYYKRKKAIINQEFLAGYEPWPGNVIDRIRDKNIMNSGADRVDDIISGIGYSWMFWVVVPTRKLIGSTPMIRYFQYLIGVLKFYEDYLNDFLELSDSNDESNGDETIIESEKKN